RLPAREAAPPGRLECGAAGDRQALRRGFARHRGYPGARATAAQHLLAPPVCRPCRTTRRTAGVPARSRHPERAPLSRAAAPAGVLPPARHRCRKLPPGGMVCRARVEPADFRGDDAGPGGRRDPRCPGVRSGVKTLSGARVGVTGGAGFIGSHLVDQLLAAGNEVTVIDDLSSGSRENLARGARLQVGSVLDAAALERAFEGVQYVFHLATRNVRLSLRQPSLVHEVNTVGTYNVLKAAAAAGARR